MKRTQNKVKELALPQAGSIIQKLANEVAKDHSLLVTLITASFLLGFLIALFLVVMKAVY